MSPGVVLAVVVAFLAGACVGAALLAIAGGNRADEDAGR